MTKNTMGNSFPIFIGAIVAAGSIAQDNIGGAIFAILAGLLLTLFMFLKARRKQVR